MKLLIHDLSNFFKIDLLYFIKNSIILSLGDLVAISTGLLLSIIFSYYLPKETYGEYSYILSIINISTLFSLSGMLTVISRGVAKGHDGVYAKCMESNIKWSFLGTLFIIGFYTYNAILFNKINSLYLAVAFIFPLYTTADYYNAYFNGKKMFINSIKINSLFSIISFCLLSLSAYLNANAFILCLVYFASFILINGFFSYKLYFKTLHAYYDTNDLTFGKHLSIMNALQILSLSLDKFLIGYFLGFQSLAIYMFAIILPEQLKNLFKHVADIAFPKLSKMSRSVILKDLPRKYFQFLIIVCIFTGLYYISIPFIFKIVFPKYPESIKYSQLFSISLIHYPTIIFILALQALKETKKLYIYNIVFPLIQIIALVLLVPKYGILGAIYSRIIGRTIFIILGYALFKACK